MKILWMLTICIFSSTANAQSWDAISAAWKAEVETVTSRCTGEYQIEVLSSGENTASKVECEIARSGLRFYSIQKRDGTFVSVNANNPSYSFQLGRVKGQDEWSITAVKPSLVEETNVMQVLCREGYGAGANLLCLPVVWRELSFMTESSNFSSLEVQQMGDHLEVNFAINKELYASGRFPFEDGKLTLLKEYPFWPTRMELSRKGEVITKEMVEMMIKSGIKGSDGKPVSLSLAGKKMDDGKLIAVWTYASESGGDMLPQKLEVSGNAYSHYSVVRTDKDVIYDDDKTYLTHWGFAEPTGMPSRNGLGLWGWLIVGAFGFVVVVFSYLKFKR